MTRQRKRIVDRGQEEQWKVLCRFRRGQSPIGLKEAFMKKLIYAGLEECVQFQKTYIVCMSGEALFCQKWQEKSHIYKSVREFVRTIGSPVLLELQFK